MFLNTEEFYNTYKENILLKTTTLNENEKALIELCKTGVVKSIYDFNSSNLTGDMVDATFYSMHGSRNLFKCSGTNCKTVYTSDYVFADNNANYECELCGKKLVTEYVLPERKYNDNVYYNLNQDIINANVFIVIGPDYRNNVIATAVADFCNTKAGALVGGKNDEKLLVTISEDEEVERVNSFGFSEYCSLNRIKNGIENLTKLLEE